jgi:hypothetical protein
MVGLLTVSASGRIGETKEQCDARYGMPKSVIDHRADSFDSSADYEKGGVSVTVYFMDGKASLIYFGKTNRIGPQAHKELWHEYEIRALLERNGGGKKWELIPEEKLVELGKTMEAFRSFDDLVLLPGEKPLGVWTTSDRELIAINYTDSNDKRSDGFCMVTRTSLERELERLKTERMKQLEGF